MEKRISSKISAGLTLMTLVLLIALQLAVITVFAGMKDGFDIDELWTHGLANSYQQPFVAYKTGAWMDGNTFTDYLTVGRHGHEYLNVYENQIEDVHPPLYYLCMHMVCSVFKAFSKWNGIVLNYVFFVVTQIALFVLCCRVLSDKREKYLSIEPKALGPVAAYGFGAGAVSSVVFIRMYAMMTMWAVLLALMLVLLWQEGHQRALMFLLKAVLIAGFLTQYYFVIFACMFCGIYFVSCCISKKWKQAWQFAGVCLFALTLAVGLFPWCLEHIFAGYRGKGAIEQAASVQLKDWMRWANLLVSAMNREQFANMLSLMLGLCALMLGIGVFRRGEINRFTVQVSVLAAAAGMAYLSVIAVVSPYKVDRYIFCIYPLMTAAVWMLMINGLQGMGLKEAISVILVSCALLGADAYTLNTGNVNYLYRGRSQYVDIAEDHGKLPCVLLGSNDLTENLLELGAYDRVFVLGNEDWEQVSPALEAHGGYDPEQGFVLYQRYGDSDIVEKVVEHTGAHQAELLYTHLFDVYRIQ